MTLEMEPHGQTVSGRGVLAMIAAVLTLGISISFLISYPLPLDPAHVLFAATPVVGSTLPILLLHFDRLAWAAFAAGALVLFVAGLWSALVGGLAYWVPGAVLLAAALSPVGWRPRMRRVAGVIGSVVGSLALVLGGLAVYENFLAPYNAYHASLVSSLSSAEYERLDDAVLRLPGVEAVGGSFPPRGEITVWLQDGLSSPGRDQLAQRLTSLPQIRGVEPCRC
jgi:hypothetical protein